MTSANCAFAQSSETEDKNRDQWAGKFMDGKIAEIKANAAKNHPGDDEVQAMRKESIAEAGQMLKDTKNDDDRRQIAAGMFFGFYVSNARTRVEFCNEQGVNIEPFVTLFKRNNAPALAAATPLLAKSGMDQDRMYLMIKPQMRKLLDMDMKSIAQAGKTDSRGACELIVTNANLAADNLQMSEIEPAAYRVLMGAQ